MPLVPFDTLPDDARLWIYAASRPLPPIERDALLSAVDTLLTEWRAHGAPLTTGRDWRHDRFLFIGVDERTAGVSGCSIDALHGGLRAIERRLGVALLNGPPAWYRQGEQIVGVSREEFADLARAGRVGLDTPVFDTTVMSMGDVRSGGWERPLAGSWYQRAFF